MKSATKQAIIAAFLASTDLSAIAAAHGTRVHSVLEVIRAVVKKSTVDTNHADRWARQVAACIPLSECGTDHGVT